MRILVSSEENGTARARESRKVFDVAELRLSYTCPKCKTQFVFGPDTSEPLEKWRKCPICGKEPAPKNSQAAVPDPTLWEALESYRSFYDFVIKKSLLPELKLVIRPRADADKTPSDLQMRA
jgi:DNA-directed RNA polymerase subunit RPC12/RpoP